MTIIMALCALERSNDITSHSWRPSFIMTLIKVLGARYSSPLLVDFLLFILIP